MRPRRRWAAGVLLVLLAGAAIRFAAPPGAPPPILLLDRVPLTSGVSDVPPQPTFSVTFPPGSGASDYRADLDGAEVALVPSGESAGLAVAALALPRLGQGTWHHVRLSRRGLGQGLRPATDIAFRVVEPLRGYAAWTLVPGAARVDLGWSRPLADPGALPAMLAGAGATVEQDAAGVTGRWSGLAPGARVGFRIPAGVRAVNGAFLESAFEPAVTLAPAGRSTEVQVSSDRAEPVGEFPLKLQVYYVAGVGARADLATHARQIDILSPSFYSLDGRGKLQAAVDPEVLALARAAGAQVEPLVTNAGFDSAATHDLLADEALTPGVVAQLVAEARSRGYAGYQLDFENLATGDRDALTRFSAGLASGLGSAGLRYSAAVVPRKAQPGTLEASLLGLTGSYDYAGLGRGASWLTMMAYDQHTSRTGPGPVAGIDWVRDVMDGSSGGIAPGHLYLGVPLYQRDWTLGDTAAAGGYQLAVTRLVETNSRLQWDFDSESSYFRYTDAGQEHVVWLEDRASLRAKLRLAASRHLAGVSAWRLGFEDPAFWGFWKPRAP